MLQMLLVLGFYFLSRIGFTLFNHSYFPELSLSDWIGLSIAAIRFDLSAFFMCSGLYLTLLFFPFGAALAPVRKKVENGLFLFINLLAMLFEWADWIYFPYNQKRATADVLQMLSRKGDFINQLPQLLLQYWYLLLLIIALSSVFVWLNNKIIASTPFVVEAKKKVVVYWTILGWLGAILVSIIGIRGGLQMVPIGIRNAVEATDDLRYVPIVLNTPFSIGSSLGSPHLEELNYYDDETLEELIPVVKQYHKTPFRPKNVVVLIMESCSKEFTGIGGMQSYTPFLDSIMQQGLVCTNAFANGYRSAEAIPAILAGIPSITQAPFTTSPYGANRINSLANLLQEKGYQSAFYHGGTNGTMSFDLFARNAGFMRYVGRTEYNNEKDFDGRWGIWDEAFLPYCVDDMNKHLKEPFVASIFTLSAHQPYKVPKVYQDQLPKGNLPIHQPIAYADWSLRKFFEQAQKSKWYNQTLFVLVSDHCSPLSNDDYYHYHQGRFAIPIVYFSPSDSSLKGQSPILTQQIDILPSVLDYLGFEKRFFAFGNSIFSPSKHRFTIQQWSGNLLWTLDQHFLKCADTKAEGMYDVQNDPLCVRNLAQEQDSIFKHTESYLKAFRQQYHQSMLRNKLWIK